MPPIDRPTLRAQTFDDLAIAREVLEIFAEQGPPLLQAIIAAAGAARRDLAHRLKGSALAVGALDLARAAEAVETADDDAASLGALEAALAAALADAAALLSGELDREPG